MEKIIGGTMFLVLSVFIIAVSIVWIIFPFLVLSRMGKIKAELEAINLRATRPQSKDFPKMSY